MQNETKIKKHKLIFYLFYIKNNADKLKVNK